MTDHRAVGTEVAQVGREVAMDWGVQLGPAFALSNYSFVAPVGDDAVLKVQSPDDVESALEPEALALWNGDGAVRLLRHERARRALLLERARPGTDLTALGEDEATVAAIEVARRLWRPAGEPFESVHRYVPGWLDAVGEHALVPVARETYARLGHHSTILIHGDLHHHNVLRHGAGWLAIDPKPMLAEPEFDVPPFLWNPIGSVPTADRTERRITAFVEAGLDEERIRAWTVVRGTYLGLPDRLGRQHEDAGILQVIRHVLVHST